MSDDLISRKAVIDLIKNCHVLEDSYCLIDYINELPVSCNADKIIEQLEENAKYFQGEADELAQKGDWGTAADLQGRSKAYKDAAKIIKSGGVADD